MVPLSDDEFLPEPVSNDDLPKVATENELEMKNPYIQAQFDALGSKDKMKLVEAVAQVESERVAKVEEAASAAASAVPAPIVVNTPTVQMTQDTMGILKVDEPPAKSDDDGDDEKSDDEKSGGGVKKVVAFS